jgi:hypothetical protein
MFLFLNQLKAQIQTDGNRNAYRQHDKQARRDSEKQQKRT